MRDVMPWLIMSNLALLGISDPPNQSIVLQTASFVTPDGGSIPADLYGSGPRGVVLVAHGGYSFKARWQQPAEALAADGFHVLAFDTRAAIALKNGKETPCLADASCMAIDVLAAVRYLRRHGATSVFVVGGSAGGAAVAQASIDALPGEIERIVLLAPMPTAHPEKMKGRKLFAVARNDLGSDARPRLPTVRDQFRKAPRPKQLLILEGSAHGQLMFEASEGATLLREVRRFLVAR